MAHGWTRTTSQKRGCKDSSCFLALSKPALSRAALWKCSELVPWVTTSPAPPQNPHMASRVGMGQQWSRTQCSGLGAAQAPVVAPSHSQSCKCKTSSSRPSVKHLCFTTFMPPPMKPKKNDPRAESGSEKNIWSLWESLSFWMYTRSRDHFIFIPLTASNFFQMDDF